LYITDIAIYAMPCYIRSETRDKTYMIKTSRKCNHVRS